MLIDILVTIVLYKKLGQKSRVQLIFDFHIFFSDPCEPPPCRNGGTCTKTSHNTFNCTCAIGWIGDKCKTKGNPVRLLQYV